MKIFQIQQINPQQNITEAKNIVKRHNSQNDTQLQSYSHSSTKLLGREYYSGIIIPSISFTAVDKSEYQFEQDFPHSFFKKLLRENLKDAYTGKGMISRDDISALKNLGVLNKRSSISLKYLRDYKDDLYDREKDIYLILRNASQKHPNLTIQELLQLKYDKAEIRLLTNQMRIIHKINLAALKLPKNEYNKVKEIIDQSLYQMYLINPSPEERFSRKIFINQINSVAIQNQKTKDRLIKYATQLPQSSNSIDAFIVKYSQPYKVKKNINTGKITKTLRTSEDIAIRLLEPSVATDEHIYPQTLYKQEATARKNGDVKAKKLSKYRVTILTSQKINGEKSDMLIDDFIKDGHPDIPKNIQRHIEQLITIDNKWLRQGNIQDAAKLANYILVLKDEFELRSNLIHIDLGNFEKQVPKIKLRAQEAIEKQKERKNNPNRRTKKEEVLPTIEAYHYQNRKNQTHSPKFKQ